MSYKKNIMPPLDIVDIETLKKIDEELNAFKEDLNYIEELPGQMSFDDFMLDD